MTATFPSSYSKLFDLWANAAVRRETTVDDYRKVFASFAEFVRGKELASISRMDVLGFRDALVARGQSPVTVTRKIGILKTLFRVARDYELLSANPAEQVCPDGVTERSRSITRRASSCSQSAISTTNSSPP